jgi:hypothetical protein
VVKDNQPTLREDIRLLFDPPPGALPPLDRREARTVEQGHGRRDDTRHLVASSDLNAYSDWPALAQVFRLRRTWWEDGAWHEAVCYGVTSLPPAVASAERLLAIRRGHWQIENGLHHVKDVSLGEDRSPIRTGAGPTVLAWLRDTAVGLLRQAGHRAIAARLRHNSRHPSDALAVLGLRVAENA